MCRAKRASVPISFIRGGPPLTREPAAISSRRFRRSSGFGDPVEPAVFLSGLRIRAYRQSPVLLLFRQTVVDRREGHPGGQYRMRRDVRDPFPLEIHLPAVAK